MKIDRLPPLANLAPVRLAAPAAAPAPAPLPTDSVQTTPAPPAPSIDLGKVFEKTKREPQPPDKLASWSWKAPDSCSIDETVRLPDGSAMVIARSFDTSDNKKPHGYVTCFNPDGTVRWTYTPPQTSYSRDRIESHLLLGDGTSYAITRGDQAWDEAHLVALDASGKERWTWTADGREKIDSVRPTANGAVMAKMGDTVVCVGADGKEQWRKKMSIHSDAYFHVVGADGTQIFANDDFSNNFGADRFYGVSPDGKGKSVRLPDISSFPLQMGNTLVYGGADGKLVGVALDGKYGHWDVQTASERGLKTPYAGRDGNVYVEGRFDERVYAMSPDGRLLWEREITDAAPRGFGLDDLLQVAPNGDAYYLREGADKIACIRPDGKPGKDIQVSEGVDSFQVGPDGKVYAWTSESTVVVHDPVKGLSTSWPVEVDHPNVWNLREVLDNGDIVFEGQGEVHHLHLSEQEELDRKLGDVISSQPAEAPPTIEREPDWVVIGGVRVPVRRG